MARAASAAVGPPPGLAVRLSSNESPFGPSPAVLDVLRGAAGEVHRYPDDQSVALRDAIAREETVPIERVAVGHGSAALLMDLVALACREPGPAPPAVLTYERAFIVYRLAAQTVGAHLEEAPLTEGFARDPDALFARIGASTRILLIDNPSNPTGAHFRGEDLRHLVESVPEHVMVVIDEAYHHFAEGQRGYATVAELGLQHPRLAVTRTFSKAYALAGLRVGYLLGQRDLVAAVDSSRVRFNLSSLAQAAAAAALRDRKHLERTITGTLDGRARMAEGLCELGVGFLDGLGNFLLVDVGQPAGPVVASYGERGVGVRELSPYGLGEHIRVTVGTPKEVDAFLAASAEAIAGVVSRRRNG
ncbi:MAG: aminotransferase class I/II-fold pyridoxal phosphate-dependent enzyme [Actinomycetota bacterium]|nr:aminotransferase class I/II-fold pyridoxal phosphate-dependent enzyme [Actinomycetota bacterium]